MFKRIGHFVFVISFVCTSAVSCGGNDLLGIGNVGSEGDTLLPSVVDSIIDVQGVPALGVMTVGRTEDGIIRDIAVRGLRAVGSGTPVTRDDLWHIGSLTKAMTATLAARLVEKGIIAWETTVAEVFPDFVGTIEAAYDSVRLDELMYHTSGLPSDITMTPSWPLLRTDPSPLPAQRRRWAEELLSLAPGASRGTYLYTNAGYVVAGAMMEELTGQSWEQLMRVEVFDPLEMGSAGFGPPGSVGTPPDQPRGHTNDDGLRPVEPDVNADNPAALGPAGTVHVSLDDYAKFLVAHLDGLRDSSTYLSTASWTKLHTAAPETGYALGWGVDRRTWAGGRTLAHSGSNTLWFAVAWLAPVQNVAFFAVTNVGGDLGERTTDQAVNALILRAGLSF